MKSFKEHLTVIQEAKSTKKIKNSDRKKQYHVDYDERTDMWGAFNELGKMLNSYTTEKEAYESLKQWPKELWAKGELEKYNKILGK